jgi:hypothetical protein
MFYSLKEEATSLRMHIHKKRDILSGTVNCDIEYENKYQRGEVT